MDLASYYYRKKFYSILLQVVVNCKYKFWNNDFGLAKSIHNWLLFQKSEIGKRYMNEAFLPHKLIGNAAYPIRP